MGFVFGALNADAVPGPILVDLMVVLGIGESTTRQLLARMLKQGDLRREKAGRVSVYHLDGQYLERWLRLRHGDTPPSWPGFFRMVVHDIPERHRFHRETLHAAAVRAGFGQLRPGVLIGTKQASFVEPVIGATTWPTNAALVETGHWEVEQDVARRIATVAWRLDEGGVELRGAADRLEALLDESPGRASDPASPYRTLFRAIGIAARPRFTVPQLPVELLPDDWPAGRVQELVETASGRLRQPTGEYLYHYLVTSPHAALVRGGWWPEVAAEHETRQTTS